MKDSKSEKSDLEIEELDHDMPQDRVLSSEVDTYITSMQLDMETVNKLIHVGFPTLALLQLQKKIPEAITAVEELESSQYPEGSQGRYLLAEKAKAIDIEIKALQATYDRERTEVFHTNSTVINPESSTVQ